MEEAGLFGNVEKDKVCGSGRRVGGEQNQQSPLLSLASTCVLREQLAEPAQFNPLSVNGK